MFCSLEQNCFFIIEKIKSNDFFFLKGTLGKIDVTSTFDDVPDSNFNYIVKFNKNIWLKQLKWTKNRY